ncbi:hypothetical protein KBZ12_12255 [Cyanobium sp. Cruz CV13-4-11]|jgi:hypothetical protein|uniref:hypothetical protein n=1 Tax=unclassified Cyanobium TaxID=2627006 RepID=UPI0020CF440D|nr:MULTISPECIES: hypothetical protein [unclassified Cyanobium]MCP9901145.1 hypothetical protein [Cyanobium sp. Cruz CV11-17]MCP9920236.1 hypothetical protein [Cyanobium sp. Cruz CV13-4-11]
MTRCRPARRWLHLAVLLLVAVGLPEPLTRAARADNWSYQRLVEAFEQRSFSVLGSHPRCAERGLYGLYLRESRRIVVCPRGNLNDTLLHEGWHAVQSRCLRGRPHLGEEELRRGLSRRDRHDLARLYGEGRWQREAEARVMARRDPAAYLRLVDELCAASAPPTPAPLEGTPQGQAKKRTGS